MVHCFLQTWQEKIGTSETYLSLCTFSFEVVITVLLTFLSFGTSSTVVYDKSSWKRKKVCRTLSSFEINCKLNVKYCAQHRAVSNSKARIDNGLKLQQSCFQNLRQGVKIRSLQVVRNAHQFFIFFGFGISCRFWGVLRVKAAMTRAQHVTFRATDETFTRCP